MGPLKGVRVVEIASLAPAPFGCMILADLGAEVVRVDRAGTPGDGIVAPEGPLDRGKHSIALNLKEPEDLEVLYRLIESADVVVEGFRPGAAERLGIGPEELIGRNPRLVYGRMTGWGQCGPLALAAGHDINYIAVAGALEPIGRPGERPVPPLNLIGDFAGGGLLLAMGIVSALYERERSGVGQVVDAAMVDGAALLTAFLHGMGAIGLWGEGRGENALDGGAPFYDTYECADGRYIAVGAIERQFYDELVDGLGLAGEDLPDRRDQANWPQLRARFAAAFAARTRDEWTAVFAGTDACVTPVLRFDEVAGHPHAAARGALIDVDGVTQAAPAPRFSRTAPAAPSPPSAKPAGLGEILAQWRHSH